ncbi:hypothetical protein H0H87_011499 [Tephrocybe sp. NHM501043]|nr:hypothetical protein H0H87_011499 [Tephrocybe sp. NHM501043]
MTAISTALQQWRLSHAEAEILVNSFGRAYQISQLRDALAKFKKEHQGAPFEAVDAEEVATEPVVVDEILEEHPEPDAPWHTS